MPTKRIFIFSLIILLSCQCLQAVSSNHFLTNCKEAVTTQSNIDAITQCEGELSEALANREYQESSFIQLELATLYGLKGDYLTSNDWLKQVRQSEAFQENTEVRYLWNRKTGLNLLHESNYSDAEDYLKEAYQLAKLLEDTETLAKSANDLGLIYYKQKHYKNALLYYKESLKFKETLGNKYYIGTTLNNLGLLNKDLKNYKESIQYYEQALNQFLEYTEQEDYDQRVFNNISHLYEDLAVTHSLAGSAEQGEKYRRRIINTFSRKLARNDKVRALKNLAQIHVEQKEPEKAQPFIQEAEHYATGDSKYVAEIDYIKAAIAYLKKEYTEARYLLKQSIPLSKNNNDSAILEKSYYLLHQLDVAEDNLKGALNNLTLSYRYKEQALAEQYQGDLRVIQEQIEKERVERRLIAEQLKSQQQSNQIQSLSNTVLLISLIAVIIAFIAAFTIYRKAKEKQRLLASIKTHKEKVLLLESEQEAETLNDRPGDEKSEHTDDLDFRQVLVELLIETLALWEKSTQTDRIELAEKSGIWKVSIDDGRLRTRSLDKYIDINKIPQNPRWRNVVKTSHYVLAECSVESQERAMLEAKLDRVMSIIKERSTSKSP